MAELEPRGGHFKIGETMASMGGEPALMHELGDFETAKRKDVHLLHGSQWIDLVYDYAAGDEHTACLFDEIVRSFSFEGEGRPSY